MPLISSGTKNVCHSSHKTKREALKAKLHKMGPPVDPKATLVTLKSKCKNLGAVGQAESGCKSRNQILERQKQNRPKSARVAPIYNLPHTCVRHWNGKAVSRTAGWLRHKIVDIGGLEQAE